MMRCSGTSLVFTAFLHDNSKTLKGISLQLSEELSQAEEVYMRALSLATTDLAHAIFSNLGDLYRQQKHYERAKAMFTKSLELQPGYAPTSNNLGLVFVAEGQWEEAKFCFKKALQADPMLDAAKSNLISCVYIKIICRLQLVFFLIICTQNLSR